MRKPLCPTQSPAPPEPASVPRLTLSVPEAAESTGMCVSTLYSLMKAGELAYVKIRARRLIPIKALEDLVARNAQGPRVA